MPIGTPSVPYRLPGSQMERWVDIYTRLGVERILFLGSEVNDGIANSLVAQMLYLDSEDSSKPIYLYINSPGGSVTAGLAIYDTIQYVKSEVVTICVGLAASMGAFLLAAGTKGKRVALPLCRAGVASNPGLQLRWNTRSISTDGGHWRARSSATSR